MIMRTSSNTNLSDDSHIDMDADLTPEMRQYRKKYQLLLERCEIIQQDNERIVHRIQRMKKMTKLYKKEIKMLMRQLDKHGDEWRTAEEEVDLKSDDFVTKRVEIKKEKNSEKGGKGPGKNINKKKTGPKKKIKTEKPDKDPNAPKRPANAFFLFCQEQRPIIMQKLTAALNQNEPNKQELTRHLALQWRNLAPEEKQVYIERYEISKEKYDEQMSAYVKKE